MTVAPSARATAPLPSLDRSSMTRTSARSGPACSSGGRHDSSVLAPLCTGTMTETRGFAVLRSGSASGVIRVQRVYQKHASARRKRGPLCQELYLSEYTRTAYLSSAGSDCPGDGPASSEGGRDPPACSLPLPFATRLRRGRISYRLIISLRV